MKDSPVLHIQSGGFTMSYKNADIADLTGIESALEETKPESLNISYDADSNMGDLAAALRVFSECGIGRYNLIGKSGRHFPFFLGGVPDKGALDRAVNTPRKTYSLDKVLEMREGDSVPRATRVVFPANPASVNDFEKCLEKCSYGGPVAIESQTIYLFTGRYEDWVHPAQD